MRRTAFTLSVMLVLGAACTTPPIETTSSPTITTATTAADPVTTTSMVTTTTVDPRSVARLDGTWYVTYRVVENELEGVEFDDFGGLVETGDLGIARVWSLEHLCDEGQCDAALDSWDPDDPEREHFETVLELREDGTYSWDPQLDSGYGACQVEDGEVFQDAFRDGEFSFSLTIAEVAPDGDGWIATSMTGTRVEASEPVDEASAAGCEIRFRTIYEVTAVRTDPGDPVPAFLPSGSDPVVDRIAYLHLGRNRRPDGVWSVNPDGTDARPIVELEGVDDLAWSPDGTRIVYSDVDETLWVMASDGSNPTEIGRGSRPAWSPDGAQIAFVRPRLDGGGDEAWAMSTLTGVTARLTEWGMSEVSVGWIDAERLLISGHALGDTGPGIWIYGFEAGDYPGLVYGSAPVASLDGSRVAYVWDQGIWTIDLDGNGDRQLTDGRFEQDPSWSPDGSEVAFARAGSIWVVGADGSNERQVAGDGIRPAWSPVLP